MHLHVFGGISRHAQVTRLVIVSKVSDKNDDAQLFKFAPTHTRALAHTPNDNTNSTTLASVATYVLWIAPLQNSPHPNERANNLRACVHACVNTRVREHTRAGAHAITSGANASTTSHCHRHHSAAPHSTHGTLQINGWYREIYRDRGALAAWWHQLCTCP